MHKSPRSIGRLYLLAQLRCRIVKLSNFAISAIEKPSSKVVFKWSSDNARESVYIVQLNSSEDFEHVVVADDTRRCI